MASTDLLRAPLGGASSGLDGARPAGGELPAGRWASFVARSGGRLGAVVLASVAVLYLVVGLRQAASDAVTIDEAVDISSGVTILVRHDLRMNPEHPPLPKVLSALPALVARPIVPAGDAWARGDWFDHTDEFLTANRDAGRLDDVVFLARLVPLVEGLACGWLLLRLGRRLFGPTAGVVASVLWLTTPMVVGLSHLAGIDVPFTLATLLVADRLLRHLDQPSLRTAGGLGLACAAALLTRHSALGLWAYAVVAVAALVWRTDRRAAFRAAGTVLFVGLAGVWLALLVLAPGGPTDPVAARNEGLIAEAADRSIVAGASLGVPFPSDYRAGLAYLVVTSDERPAYLFGRSWDGARPWYFPGVTLTKLPLAALAATALAPLALRRRPHSSRRPLVVAVLGPAAVSSAFLLAQPLNLGVRYVLPVVALALVPAGGVVQSVLLRCTVPSRRAVLGAGLAVQLLAMGEARTHALAWTAPPFRPAYRWVSDSNVDYGQDLDRVASWAQARVAEGEPVWVALLRPRGVPNPPGARELRGAPPSEVRGWVAVSATRLTAIDRDELSWLRAYCPVADIGGSVLLYRFAGAPDASDGPAMPTTRCSGGRVSTRA